MRTAINTHLEGQGLATRRPWRVGGVAAHGLWTGRHGLEIMSPNTDRLRREVKAR